MQNISLRKTHVKPKNETTNLYHKSLHIIIELETPTNFRQDDQKTGQTNHSKEIERMTEHITNLIL